MTVTMIRNFLPPMLTVRNALKAYPEAMRAVDAAVAAAQKPRNEKAEVHHDEVQTWMAQGWERADQSPS